MRCVGKKDCPAGLFGVSGVRVESGFRVCLRLRA